MARNRSVTPLSSIVPGLLEGMQTDSRPSLERMRKIWVRLVGEEAAMHSWPRQLAQGTLLVEVENSGWMYTLSLKKQMLIQGLIELLGAGRIKSLSFRIGDEQTNA